MSAAPPDAPPRPRADGIVRAAMRWIMAAFYLAAGVLHLAAPDKFLPIVPDIVPFARELILVTGVCEIAGAAGLLTARLRVVAGAALALYALMVWPANIKHALEGVVVPGLPTSWWYHGPRLAAQPVIIWWALYGSGAIDWPWRRTARRPG